MHLSIVLTLVSATLLIQTTHTAPTAPAGSVEPAAGKGVQGAPPGNTAHGGVSQIENLLGDSPVDGALLGSLFDMPADGGLLGGISAADVSAAVVALPLAGDFAGGL